MMRLRVDNVLIPQENFFIVRLVSDVRSSSVTDNLGGEVMYHLEL